MKTAILAAGALAVATLTGAQSASAKDAHFSLTLGGPGGMLKISSPGQGSHGYGSKGYGYNPYGYGKGYTQPYYGGSGYGYGYGAPRGRYGRGYRPHKPHRRHCMAPRQIRWMLKSQGWYGFELQKLTPKIAIVYSHRHGQRYRIKINRCNHAIIKVSPRGGFAPYGYY